MGELVSARTHLEAGIRSYDPQHHRDLAFRHGMDLGVICRAALCTTLWLMGFTDQARQRLEEALTLADELVHPYSLGFALNQAVEFHLRLGEFATAQERLEALRQLAAAHGFTLWRIGKTNALFKPRADTGPPVMSAASRVPRASTRALGARRRGCSKRHSV
ncbi:MAG: hypothetical protein OEU26_15390 [Candidatus Tectomicrobia bacterium]|nr:hypothetical protein [Candidatus Tectomicrobia bacterium]